MSRFLAALHTGRVVLMDGAMGSELLRAGLPLGTPCEAWNLTQPDQVLAIHRAYVAAGADCLVANTFLAQPGHLERHGLAERLADIQAAALALARQAAGPERFVLASVGPLGGDPSTWPANLQSILPGLRDADAILFETWSDTRLFAVLRDLEWAATKQPWLVSFAYRPAEKGYELEAGTAPGAVATSLAGPVAALGVNCGRDIDLAACASIVQAYRDRTSVPLLARPNAGTPTQVPGGWQYPLTPAELARSVPTLLQAGATLIGGCCGTTPQHIAMLRPIIDDWNRQGDQ